MQKKYIFFLGGYDAEMVTIKAILDREELPYFDKKLHWGAVLSEYKDELAAVPVDHIPVLIELRLDIPYPERAVIIDHHNERAGKDRQTSIEQVALLLGVQLDRHQQLISANDRGHIPAMKLLGAYNEEIETIRKFDRKCQGVTEEDEKKAEISIRDRAEKLTPDTILVRSLTEKSSPIMDRLFEKVKHLFILTPTNGFSYFGIGSIIERLETIYTDLKAQNPEIISWKGGNLPDYGFFGSTYAISKKEIQELTRGLF